MKDIFDKKDMILGLPFSLEFLFIFIFLIIILYLIYYFFKNKKDEVLVLEKEEIIEKTDFLKVLNNLKNELNILEDKIFFQKVSSIFRNFLEENLDYKDFSKKTLKEIKTLDLDWKYLDFLEKIYFLSYKENKISLEKKENLFKNLEKIIIN